MKTLFTSFLAVCAISFSSEAQVANLGTIEGMGMRIVTGSSRNEVSGSPYFDETYRPAKIENSPITSVRYNAYADRIEFLSGKEPMELIKKEGILIKTTDGKYTYVYTNYTLDDKSDTGYLLLLKDLPKVKMYAKQSVILQEAYQSNGYQNSKPASYKKDPIKYLIKVGDKEIVPVSPKKKELAKLFPGKETEIADFLKNNKISDSKDEDMMKLAEFLNTLI